MINKSNRRGFTLVELLIVIAIIGMLVALLLPAVNSAREAGRRTTCTNHLRELALGINAYALADSRQEYPGWVQTQVIADPSAPAPYPMAISWAAKILPHIDQRQLWEQILTNNEGAGFTGQFPTRQNIYICPSDAGTDPGAPRLTYVANTGRYDFHSANESPIPGTSDHKANGVLHDHRRAGNSGRVGPVVRHGADIGSSNTTLLLSENIHKIDGLNWLGGAALAEQFVNANEAMGESAERFYGMVWVTDPTAHPQAPFNRESPPPAQGGFGPPQPSHRHQYARPASAHPDVFNVAFAGGNTRSVRENIEYRVYIQLMAANTSKIEIVGNTPAQNLAFRQLLNERPLSDGDY